MHRHDPGDVYFVLQGEFVFYAADGLPLQRLTGGGAFQPHSFGPIVDVRGG
jgi:hypothetical protein